MAWLARCSAPMTVEQAIFYFIMSWADSTGERVSSERIECCLKLPILFWLLEGNHFSRTRNCVDIMNKKRRMQRLSISCPSSRSTTHRLEQIFLRFDSRRVSQANIRESTRRVGWRVPNRTNAQEQCGVQEDICCFRLSPENSLTRRNGLFLLQGQ